MIFALMFASLLAAADNPYAALPEAEQKRWNAEREKRIERLDAEIKQKRLEARQRRSIKQRRAVEAEIDKLRDARAVLDKNEPPYIADLPGSLAVDAVGELRDDRVKIVQVLDKQNALVELSWTVNTVTVRSNTVIPSFVDRKALVWLRGVSTAGWSDGKGVTLPGIFKVTGNETYETAISGSKTVMVLEPFELMPKPSE